MKILIYFLCILFITFGIINLILAFRTKFVTADLRSSDKYINKTKYVNDMFVLYLISGLINIITSLISVFNTDYFKTMAQGCCISMMVIYGLIFEFINNRYGLIK